MIELTDWLRDELIRRADREAPLEACGLISRARKVDARGKRPISLWEAENVAGEPETSFLIDPKEQTEILMQIWKGAGDLVGVYHSHPRGPATPSETDLTIARGHLVPLTWVIVGRCTECDGAGSWSDWNGEEGGGGPCGACGETGFDFFAGELP